MSESFLKFKRKNNIGRAVKSLLYGLSAGLLFAGIFLVLSKLCVIDLEPIVSLFVGIGVFFIVGIVVFFALKKSSISLARELDGKFKLDERVETMLAYKDECGTLVDIQRSDTEKLLSEIPIKKYKIKKLWIAFAVLLISSVAFCCTFAVPNLRDYEVPQTVVPFELTKELKDSMEILIANVKKSEMEEPYRTEIADELERLLAELETTHTLTDMHLALAASMAIIHDSTSDSSSMTEIANALWNTGDQYAKTLAMSINTSDWGEKTKWNGTFAEKYAAMRQLYDYVPAEGEEAPTEENLHSKLGEKLSYSALKIRNAMSDPKIPQDDAIRKAVLESFVDADLEKDGEAVLGIGALFAKMPELSYTEALKALDSGFSNSFNAVYAALETAKINADVGEYVMKELSTLFRVPRPAFERPDFTKSDDSDNSDKENGGDQNNNGSIGGGGGGGGAIYGSDDYVLDPITGEYVKYSELLADYTEKMNQKLENGNYTEEQKQAILKYFNLLYYGLEKDEDK